MRRPEPFDPLRAAGSEPSGQKIARLELENGLLREETAWLREQNARPGDRIGELERRTRSLRGRTRRSPTRRPSATCA